MLARTVEPVPRSCPPRALTRACQRARPVTHGEEPAEPTLSDLPLSPACSPKPPLQGSAGSAPDSYRPGLRLAAIRPPMWLRGQTLLSCVGRCGPAAGRLGVVFWARFVGSDGRA